jgi:TatD DNase family protein
MIDIHCHLAYPGLDEIKEEVVRQSIGAGMKGIITCGYPKDLQKNYELVKKYPGFLYLAVGLHPIEIKDMTQKEIDAYWDWTREHVDEIVAVGEIGLEKKEFSDEKLLAKFKEVFIQGLDLAKELKKPAVLHLRKAEKEGFDTVVEQGMKDVVFHYYSGNMTLAKQIIEKGFYISIPTTINRSANLKDIGKKFPLEMLLTETDAPFSSPFPNQPNVPMNVRLTIEKIAELRKTSFDEVDKQTTENAERVFNLGKFIS